MSSVLPSASPTVSPGAESTAPRGWPMAVLLGVAFLSLLTLAALTAAFLISR